MSDMLLDVRFFLLNEENKRLRHAYKILREKLVCPKPRRMEGIPKNVLVEGLQMAWEYSMNGIEGTRHGHILAFGPEALMDAGKVKGRRGKSWSYYDANIQCESDRADLMKEMNFDGAHIILPCGRIIAGSFFVQTVDNGGSGGAGHGAAKSLSLVPGSVVLKISADGAITEFRGGQKFKHCGSRSVPALMTEFDSASISCSCDSEGQSEKDISLSEFDVLSDQSTPRAEVPHEHEDGFFLAPGLPQNGNSDFDMIDFDGDSDEEVFLSQIVAQDV